MRRTFGFVDLSDFTSFAYTYGDDAAVSELSTFRSVMRSVGSATGVRTDKWLGDGAMLVGLDAVSLVSAILQITRECADAGLALSLHAGVAEGDVILFEGDDYVGVTVNLAARLSDLATAGQVLAPVELFRGLDRSKGAIGEVEAPGFDPIEVADLALVPDLVELVDL